MPTWFELNLYGIEIAAANGMQMGEYGFELNLYGIEIAAANGMQMGEYGFELNLYGIEMKIRFMLT